MKKIALIPSYEPDDKLIETAKSMKDNHFDVVVVDDGSGKKYKEIFEKCNKYSKVISYDVNKGKGYALKTGLKYIDENFKDYVVVTVDSDGQHKALDASRVCNEAIKNKNTLILGKRKRNETVPLRSRIGNSITRFVFKKVSGSDIYDTQTGLRAFTSSLTSYMLSITGNRFEYEMNVLLNCNKNEIDIKEVEIETIYLNENKGSHFNTLKDSYRIYKEIIKYSMSSIISFVIDFSSFLFLSYFYSVTISNILARIISASFNFTYNRKIVFKSKKKLKDTLINYVLLAMFILLCNTILLNIFVSIGINKLISKLLTELIMFFISFGVQRQYVF